MHLPQLIKDLALILMTAGITTLLFKILKQPVVLGYIIAGFIVSPHFGFAPTVIDESGITTWADIGVIFLLFALGIEFSFKKLMKVGGSASITGIVEISLMFIAGYIAGYFFGWSFMDRLFLGGIISISSTTIISRAFDELKLKTQSFTQLVIGVLVIEDIVAIILLVLLSTLAVSKTFDGVQVIFSVLKLVFFLSAWFIVGIFVVPGALKRMHKWLNDETLLVVSLGLCLGMVVFAAAVGFSAALGAFVMGSILSETTLAERIEHLLTSVKDLFGAIFFVSVGMLINPALLVQNIVPVIILTVLVIVGKTLFVSVGLLVSGKPLKQAVQSGTSMSQIGEFSFIIATLGVSLHVTNSFLYPVAVGVSVITTFTTPYMIKLSPPLYRLLIKILPAAWVNRLEHYSVNTQTIEAESDWKKVINDYLQVILVNAVIIIAIVLLASEFLYTFLLRFLHTTTLTKSITLAIALMAMLPFLWAMAGRKINSAAYKNLWLNNKYNHGALVLLEIARNLAAIVLFGFLVRQIFSDAIALIASLCIMLLMVFVFRNRLENFYSKIERRFVKNLQQKEEAAAHASDHLLPWDAHIATFKISPHALFIGQTLETLKWRETYGVNIAFIERGDHAIYAPARFEKIYPYDIIGVIGTDEELQQINEFIQNDLIANIENKKDDIVLQKIVIDKHLRIKGKTIRQSGIRESTDGLIVGIERNGKRILNPASDTVFEWDDIVWIVGDKHKIQSLASTD
jgi:CPA2 family monovalent cation:H+ antiporter-2